MTYKDNIIEAMKMLGKDDYTVIGQSVKWKGTGLFWTLKDAFPEDKRIELPIFEDIQMGMSTGMALAGEKVLSIYPRIDFLLLAMNQLVNHLDKTEEMSNGQFKPKVIIRTSIGSIKPLFPGPQHNQDHTEALKLMLTNINVIKLTNKEMVLPEYKKAMEANNSTILIEIPDLYNT